MSKVVNEYKMLKQNNKDCLYLFRLGRFYCFIGEDAEKINNYMVLKKTKFSNEYDKCGFPVDRIDAYKRVFKNLNLKVRIIDDINDTWNIDIETVSKEELKYYLRQAIDYIKKL